MTASTSGGSSRTGFLIMPFSSELEWLREDILEAGKEAGFNVTRADDIFAPGSILDQILAAIDAADVIVCVCTGRNPNVFFELGYAWARQNTVLLAQSVEDLPSDFAHYRAFIYGAPTPQLDRAALRSQISQAMLAAADNGRGRATESAPTPIGRDSQLVVNQGSEAAGSGRLDQRQARVTALEALEQERSRDPIPTEHRQTGHLYVAAVPLEARHDAALSLVSGSDAHERIGKLIEHALAPVPGPIRGTEPSLAFTTRGQRTASGFARTSYEYPRREDFTDFSDPQRRRGERGMARFELREDGGVLVTLGRLVDEGPSEVRFVLVPLVVATCLAVINAAADVADQMSYSGPWALGVRGTGLRGAHSSDTYNDVFGRHGMPLDEDDYERAVGATGDEVQSDRGRLAGYLVGPLVDMLNARERYEDLLR